MAKVWEKRWLRYEVPTMAHCVWTLVYCRDVIICTIVRMRMQGDQRHVTSVRMIGRLGGDENTSAEVCTCRWKKRLWRQRLHQFSLGEVNLHSQQ
jgi:hypothetical protein